MSRINSFKDLIVFKKAYKLAMEIFEITKSFPKGNLIKDMMQSDLKLMQKDACLRECGFRTLNYYE